MVLNDVLTIRYVKYILDVKNDEVSFTKRRNKIFSDKFIFQSSHITECFRKF
jgi:hypothetical protein